MTGLQRTINKLKTDMELCEKVKPLEDVIFFVSDNSVYFQNYIDVPKTRARIHKIFGPTKLETYYMHSCNIGVIYACNDCEFVFFEPAENLDIYSNGKCRIVEEHIEKTEKYIICDNGDA
jgi:hypothetical protein